MNNAMISCCEVVIVTLSKVGWEGRDCGPRGTIYLMISWDPITMKDNITK
jgi:hypothetical protein